MLITPAYAAVFANLFVLLSARTIRLRRKLQVALGSGEHPSLLKAMRAHSNFAEYVPITLLLIFFAEGNGVSQTLIHTLCIGLLLGRLIHAYGLSQVKEDLRLRVAGMVLTFTAMVTASVRLLISYL
ncbi:MAG: MAPEG family protein [Myxococcota bacterium]